MQSDHCWEINMKVYSNCMSESTQINTFHNSQRIDDAHEIKINASHRTTWIGRIQFDLNAVRRVWRLLAARGI
jgi:hypothetical protein